MKAVVQRVSAARVLVDGEVVGEIGPGLCVLLGIARGDGEEAVERLAGRVARLRIFENDEGKFDRSLLDVAGQALVVSQFTLIADTAKGNRPSFTDAAAPEQAEPLYERFCAALRELGVAVATGRFGARMAVEVLNDGPVTIVLDYLAVPTAALVLALAAAALHALWNLLLARARDVQAATAAAFAIGVALYVPIAAGPLGRQLRGDSVHRDLRGLRARVSHPARRRLLAR